MFGRRTAIRPLRIGLLCVALSGTCAAADGASDSDVVSLSIPDCEAISGVQIRKLVGLELPSSLALLDEDDDEGAAVATLRALLRCTGSRAVITVEDSRRPQPLVLRLRLDDTRDEARPRFLALSIAELIATSRLERSAAPAKGHDATPARGESAPPPSRTAPSHRDVQASSFWLGAALVRGNEPAAWRPAIATGGARDAGWFSLIGDVAFDWGEQGASRAVVRTRSLSLALAPALRLSAGRFTVRFGLGLRAGYVWLEATPRESDLAGRTVSGVVLLPIVQFTQELRITGPVFARLALEAGYLTKTVRGLDADRSTLVEARGLRASALLGAGVRF